MSPTGADDYAAVAEYLFGLRPRGSKYGVDRMRLLAEELGQPQAGLPTVHVAGTNGKGSVSAMVEAIVRAAGWRVGLFTSPHLVHLGERVQVNRERLTADEIVSFVRELDPAADRVAARAGAEDRPSFFEYMTAMAFLQFRRRGCDLAVMEVGLGGELDATNIVEPAVSAITSIGMDHCEWLGHSIAAIAAAKAGIIKPGRPVVLGRVPAAAERVIREVAARRGAPLRSVRAEFGEAIEAYPETNLAGDYQRWNAATAVLVARELGAAWRVDAAAMQRGLQAVAWPGRWQRVRVGAREVVLDASHNPEGAMVLERNLADLVAQTGRRPVVVVGVLGTERAAPLLDAICRYARELHLVVPREPRAAGYAALEALVPPEFWREGGVVRRATVEDVFPNRTTCAVGGEKDLVVVTGSIYLLGEVLARLEAPGLETL